MPSAQDTAANCIHSTPNGRPASAVLSCATSPRLIAPQPAPSSAAPSASESPAADSYAFVRTTAISLSATDGADPAWVVDGGRAVLTLTAEQASGGTLRYDAASNSIVFSGGGVTISAPATGITSVVLTAGDGTASFTVDLRDMLATLAMVWSLTSAADDLTVLAPESGIELSGSEDQLTVALPGALLNFSAPTQSLVVDSGEGAAALVGDVATNGADLTVNAGQITLADGAGIDTRGADRTGSITLQAHDTGADGTAGASVSLNGATLAGGDIHLTATAVDASHTTAGASATVAVRNSSLTSSGTVTLTTDATTRVNAEGAAPIRATTISRADLSGHSAVEAAGKVSVTASSTTDVSVNNDAGSASARVSRLTSASIADSVDLAASGVEVSANAGGRVTVVAAGSVLTADLLSRPAQTAPLLESATGIAASRVYSMTPVSYTHLTLPTSDLV